MVPASPSLTIPRCLAYHARRASGFSDLKKTPPMPRTRFMRRMLRDYFHGINVQVGIALKAAETLCARKSAAVCKVHWQRRSRLRVRVKPAFREDRRGGARKDREPRRELPDSSARCRARWNKGCRQGAANRGGRDRRA